MNKKIIGIIIIFVLIVSIGCVFAGCNEDTKQYDVTIWELTSTGKIVNGSSMTLHIDEDKPIGNNFTYLGRTASEYTFYTDKACTSVWNIVSDKVNCDMTLYAKKVK